MKTKLDRDTLPDRDTLIEVLTFIVQKHPPKFSTLESAGDDFKVAFRKLTEQCPEIVAYYIQQYPDIILYEVFLSIYIPGKMLWQMADELLKPRQKKRIEHNIDLKEQREIVRSLPKEREKGRGFNKENKILLSVDNILHNSKTVTERYNANIDKRTLYRLLTIANDLRTHGKPLDKYFADHSDDVRRCIAESLGSLYETNILFRSELYRQYHISRMIDSTYSMDSPSGSVSSNRRLHVP